MVSRKTYWYVKNSLTTTEKKLINFYELQWALRNSVPTVEEVTRFLKKDNPKVTQVSVNYYLQRAPVKKALESRGIPWQQHTRQDLTDQQVAAAITVMNFADTRTIPDKLDEIGVNPSQYYAWLNDPTFKNLVDNLADRNLTNIRPAAIAEFTKKINAGDWNAIKYWFETTGELSVSSAPSSETLIIKFIEIIQKHVKDPAVMEAISADLIQASGNRTLIATNDDIPALTGEVVEDPELEQAKKMIGFG